MTAPLLPTISSCFSKIDIVDLALVTDERIEKKTHDADGDRSKHSGPETIDRKAFDQPSHFQHQGVNDKGKKAQAQDIDGKRDNEKQGP